MKKGIRESLADYCDELDYSLEDAVILNKRFGAGDRKYQVAFLRVRDLMSQDQDDYGMIACMVDEHHNIRDMQNVKWPLDHSKTIFDRTTSAKTKDGRITGVPLEVYGHCVFPNGMEFSIASRGKEKSMEVFACGANEILAKKMGSKTLDEIDQEQEIY